MGRKISWLCIYKKAGESQKRSTRIWTPHKHEVAQKLSKKLKGVEFEIIDIK